MKRKILTGILFLAAISQGCKKNNSLTEATAETAAPSVSQNHSSFSVDFSDFDYKGVVWAPYGDDWTGPNVNADGTDIKNAGVKWVRVFFRSGNALAALDSLVARCNRSNAKIVAVYKKSNPVQDLGTSTQQAQQVTLLTTLINRYKSSIHYWEIENEPNLNGTWNLGNNVGMGGTDPTSPYNVGVHNYVLWLQQAYSTIKAADPTATVILGGISSFNFDPFMKRLTVEGANSYFDEVAYHPYADDPYKCVNVLNLFKRTMSTWGAKNNLPIWITEVGFHVNTTSGGSVGVANETVKASYLQSLYEKMCQNLFWKRPICWYVLHEQNYGSSFYNLTYKASASSATDYRPAYDTLKNNTHSWSYLQGVGVAITQQIEHLAIETKTDPIDTVYDTAASNQNVIKFNSNAINDSITVVVPNVPAGTYNIRVRVKENNSKGTFQLFGYKTGNYLSGSNIGGVQDCYAATDTYVELNIGNWTVGTESDKSFRFKVKGKNASSSAYTLALDYIKLIPIP